MDSLVFTYKLFTYCRMLPQNMTSLHGLLVTGRHTELPLGYLQNSSLVRITCSIHMGTYMYRYCKSISARESSEFKAWLLSCKIIPYRMHPGSVLYPVGLHCMLAGRLTWTQHTAVILSTVGPKSCSTCGCLKTQQRGRLGTRASVT